MKTKRFSQSSHSCAVNAMPYSLPCCFVILRQGVSHHHCVLVDAAIAVCLLMQEKKKAEADKQKELNDLFAIAIKQPKVPPGEGPSYVVFSIFAFYSNMLYCLLAS